jgi:hypothetical protein
MRRSPALGRPKTPTDAGADPMAEFLVDAAGRAHNPRLRRWLADLAAAPAEQTPTRPARRKPVAAVA